MSDPVVREESTGAAASGAGPVAPDPARTLWSRIKEHKVVEWTLAYAAFAYTLLHITEMLSDAQDWPHSIVRLLSFLLLLGAPLAVTLAWYHGAKALRRVTGAELVIIALLLVIAGSILWALQHRGGEREAPAAGAATETRAPTPAAEGIKSPLPRTAVAVMPFANLTGDAGKEYLGDGMAEEVINTLTKVPGLQVPARTSSFAYKGRSVDIRQIARDLNVGAVLEGSVRSAGSRIRITAQLINAQTGLHVWSNTYDRDFTDLFQLQDDLAMAIVQALEENLGLAAPTSVVQTAPARDVGAYDLYLQGFSLMLQGSEQNLRLALGLFDQALGRDPEFARAYAARSRARLSFLVRGFTLENARVDAERDALKAVALSPHLGVALQALANVSALEGKWLDAEASYQAALAAESTEPDLYSGHAMVVLAPAGKLKQAYQEGKRAYLLAPASPNHISILATLSLDTGLDADAVRFADLALALGSAPTSMSQVYVLAARHRGQYAEAARRATAALSPALREAGGADALQLLYASLGDPAGKPGAREALERLASKVGGEQLSPGTQRDLIMALSMVDATGRAHDIATRYLDEFERTGTGGGAAWGFLWNPDMRAFRRDPRFQAFVERLGLMQYWRRYGPPDACALAEGRLSCN